MHNNNPALMLEEMETLLSKFYTACHHVLLLNNEVEKLQCRIDRAKRTVTMGNNQGVAAPPKFGMLYFMRSKRDVVAAIRDRFYMYACDLGDRMDQIQNKLLEIDELDPELEMFLEDESGEEWRSRLFDW